MKIVKQFEDDDFLRKVYSWREPHEFNDQDKFIWGLGEDGNLYFKCTRFNPGDAWNTFKTVAVADHLTLKEMKRLIKEFGHLVIFT